MKRVLLICLLCMSHQAKAEDPTPMTPVQQYLYNETGYVDVPQATPQPEEASYYNTAYVDDGEVQYQYQYQEDDQINHGLSGMNFR